MQESIIRIEDVTRVYVAADMAGEEVRIGVIGAAGLGAQEVDGLVPAVRAHSLGRAIVLFCQLAEGFRAADLRCCSGLSGTDPDKLSQGAITYQLRRLRLDGFIEKVSVAAQEPAARLPEPHN